ncbi:MAG: polyphosphate kinase 1 [Pseudomonadota bacterium]
MDLTDTTELALDHPSLYFNRELSLLQFNRRVLALAQDPKVPLLERLKFLCIVSNNLDEFFEVRVAGLIQQIAFGSTQTGPDGALPEVVLETVSAETHRLIGEQYRCLNECLLPELARESICFLRRADWTAAQREWVRLYFEREVLPVLTPMSLDPAHPFPKVQNKGLNFAVTLEGRDAYGRSSPIAIVQAPRVLPRIVKLPTHIAGPNDFIFLSSIIHDNVDRLFHGLKVTGFHQFRVTRNSELFVDEEEVDNLLSALAGELPRRHFGEEVRLEVADTCPPEVVEFLLKHFKLEHSDLFQVPGPVNLARLMAVIDLANRPDLLFPPFTPAQPKAISGHTSLFALLRRRPLLLHHPYQSFSPVVEFIRQAAQDPDVLAIKQTLYRTTPNSPIVDALIDAAVAGKQVTAVVELKARFDEANNIALAERLEAVGAQVVYGIVGHKTHAKMALVVRREKTGIRLYGHLGTGNYHPRTARQYTDLSLLTADPDLTQDMNDLFMHLTGVGRAPKLRKLLQAPFSLHAGILARIRRETELARAGKGGRIIARMNSLLEPEIIRALYEASRAGVRIDLIVRGVCCLRPGISGVSDNIRVLSVVDRFLEHSRVYYFENGGESEVWAASADWMSRNFFRRLEVAFPIEAPDLRKRVMRETLELYLADNCSAWDMQSDGSYVKRRPGAEEACRAAQAILLAKYTETPLYE